jgi:hypothetical protein
LLLGAGAVSAQGVKTNDTVGVPAAQQNAPALQSAPAEKMAPAGKSDQITTPSITGQAAPTATKSDNNQQTMDKSAPAGAGTKGSSDANASADAKSVRTGRHVRSRYASGYHGPLYNSYRGDLGYHGCRHHRHSWSPWLWC